MARVFSVQTHFDGVAAQGHLCLGDGQGLTACHADLPGHQVQPSNGFGDRVFNLQARGELFVSPGDEVYEGMVVGENSRPDDMDVNPTKEKHLSNVRSSTSDELERLVPARVMSLEQALEYCAADECLEVTPAKVRVRKTALSAGERAKVRNRAKAASKSAQS